MTSSSHHSDSTPARTSVRVLPLLLAGLLLFVAGAFVGYQLVPVGGPAASPDDTPQASSVSSSEEPGEAAARSTVATEADEPDEIEGHVPSAPEEDWQGEDITDEDRAWMLEALREERARRLVARFDDEDSALDTLRRIRDHGADAEPLLDDFERFQLPFATRRVEETVIEVTPDTLDTVLRQSLRGGLDAGTTLVFAPGEYEVRYGMPLKNVSDITLRGAGMEDTVLKLRSELVSADAVDNLVIENLTIDVSERGSTPVHVRGEAAALLRNVRFRGFDGSGRFSAAIGIGANAYLACDRCEFLGGYGRRPLAGRAVALRKPAFVYMHQCLFRELESFVQALDDVVSGSVIVADACRAYDNQYRSDHDSGVEVRLRESTFERLHDLRRTQYEAQDLGGNSQDDVDPETLPALLGVLEGFERAYDDVAVSASVSMSRDRSRVDASYAKIRTLGKVSSREVVYFTGPGFPPAPRRSQPSQPLNALHQRALAVSLLPMSHATRIALETAAPEAGVPVRLRSVALEEDDEGRLLYRVDATAVKITVDATTGEIVE